MPLARTVLSSLQKTYDESYLTCSTAVYYESQCNEPEAMRCWKSALDRIYEHNANRVLPNYTPRSETEKALVTSLRQLEMQCKERIDLLEALRLSRQDEPSQQKSVMPTGIGEDHDNSNDGIASIAKAGHNIGTTATADGERGWIGGDTIPAITYNQLSRPDLPKRPRPPPLLSSEQTRSRSSTSLGLGLETRQTEPSQSSPRPFPIQTPPPLIPSPGAINSRSGSPERHTMRTTLRPRGSASSKSAKGASSHRPPLPSGAGRPGASKAATLAWTSLGLGEKLSPGHTESQTATAPDSASYTSRENSKESRWDSHSRRLVAGGMPMDERYGSPSQAPQTSNFSVSAAHSALASLSLRDDDDERALRDGDHIPRMRMAPPPRPRKDLLHNERPDAARRGGSLDIRTPEGRLTSQIIEGAHKGILEDPASLGVIAADSSLATDRNSGPSRSGAQRKSARRNVGERTRETPVPSNHSAMASEDSDNEDDEARPPDPWKQRKAQILRNLPVGVDEHASKQILNEIVVHGDEVHWGDIAGLEIAKNALRETVVYPFLRPDLFMGLREPAKGMLLFGPPGTGKTMLARAVATESKSTFFSISASSLTSKYLGESEKLVRALFRLAKTLAPSIIFVDEIDSLLSQRSDSGEHEASRRIKTEFLIQWSDLQRAAAGREGLERGKDKDYGDANRVLVLAATNLPWAIDEAARRRFVRRQYIPLPEAETRAVQFRTLLGQQKHNLTETEITELVGLTEGFSGSDITALAKDAAMGPLRSLGEALLHMSKDEIRPIAYSDFVASLKTIRPSVSKTGLKQYEDWAREFGERGG